MKKSVYALVVALFAVNISYAGEAALNSLKASVSPSVLSETVLSDVSKGYNPLAVEQLTGKAALLSENAVNISAPQNPGPASDRPTTLPNLGSKAYIARETFVWDPDAIKEIPSRELPAFLVSKSALTYDIRAQVSDILRLSAQTEPNRSAHSIMSSVISAIMVHQPSTEIDFPTCVQHPNWYAFSYAGKKDIYMCKFLINTANSQDTAQTLIHETAHVIGYNNECDATKLEMSAMEKADLQPYRNYYADQCGL